MGKHSRRRRTLPSCFPADGWGGAAASNRMETSIRRKLLAGFLLEMRFLTYKWHSWWEGLGKGKIIVIGPKQVKGSLCVPIQLYSASLQLAAPQVPPLLCCKLRASLCCSFCSSRSQDCTWLTEDSHSHLLAGLGVPFKLQRKWAFDHSVEDTGQISKWKSTESFYLFFHKAWW